MPPAFGHQKASCVVAVGLVHHTPLFLSAESLSSCSPMSLISGLGGSSRERSWFCRSTAVPGSRRRSTPRARGRCGADPPRPSQLARGRSAVHNQSFLSRSAGPHARLKGFRAEDCATTTTTTTERERQRRDLWWKELRLVHDDALASTPRPGRRPAPCPRCSPATPPTPC